MEYPCLVTKQKHNEIVDHVNQSVTSLVKPRDADQWPSWQIFIIHTIHP